MSGEGGLPIDDPGSVSRWLIGLKEGNLASAGPLWDRYFASLASMARDRLRRMRVSTGIADGEDVALSAFDSFCKGVAIGRFPDLNGRDQLWRLLVAITARKAIALARRQYALRRGGGGGIDHTGREAAILADLVDDKPTPEFAAQVAEEFEHLLKILNDDTLRRVAVLRMEGYTRDEIAERLGCARRTVARQLNLIRVIWSSSAPNPD